MSDFHDRRWDPGDLEAVPYPSCRCQRHLVCSACLEPAGECDCSDLDDELADELDQDVTEDDLAHLDPLTRTLLGHPSGIHCHTNGCPDG